VPNFRRAHVPGGTFFFTLVTYRRARFLCNEPARSTLRHALVACGRERPFAIDAMVLLPDHLHLLMTLPDGDADFSTRLRVVKKTFTEQWLILRGEASIAPAQSADQHRVWQKRFWEHTIRDQADLNAHLDYIHFNPVKHGLARCSHEWPHSTFARWVKRGAYNADWYCVCKKTNVAMPNFEGIERRRWSDESGPTRGRRCNHL